MAALSLFEGICWLQIVAAGWDREGKGGKRGLGGRQLNRILSFCHRSGKVPRGLAVGLRQL